MEHRISSTLPALSSAQVFSHQSPPGTAAGATDAQTAAGAS